MGKIGDEIIGEKPPDPNRVIEEVITTTTATATVELDWADFTDYTIKEKIMMKLTCQCELKGKQTLNSKAAKQQIFLH